MTSIQPYYYKANKSPFVWQTSDHNVPEGFKIPQNIGCYDGNTDPDDHLFLFTQTMEIYNLTETTWCKLFPITLRGTARVWFKSLLPKSISSYEQLAERFRFKFLHKKLQDTKVEISCMKTVSQGFCILEFDGVATKCSSKAGAGVVLGDVYCVYKGLGIASYSVAQHQALILGLRYALERGFRHIRVQGDSKLVCTQVVGLWQANEMMDYYEVVKKLKEKFLSFEISHVEMEENFEADVVARMGLPLPSCEFQEGIMSYTLNFEPLEEWRLNSLLSAC